MRRMTLAQLSADPEYGPEYTDLVTHKSSSTRHGDAECVHCGQPWIRQRAVKEGPDFVGCWAYRTALHVLWENGIRVDVTPSADPCANSGHVVREPVVVSTIGVGEAIGTLYAGRCAHCRHSVSGVSIQTGPAAVSGIAWSTLLVLEYAARSRPAVTVVG